MEDSVQRHIGVIQVNATLLEDILDVNTIDIQARLRDEGVFHRVSERLMLPESYSMVAIFCELLYHRWNIFVESPSIPLVDVGESYPEIHLLYTRNEDGPVHLTDIEVRIVRHAITFEELMKGVSIRTGIQRKHDK